MGKRVTSKKQSPSPKPWDRKAAAHVLGTPEGLGDAILSCLRDNDLEGLQDVLIGFLRHVPNKARFAKEAKLSRQVLYDLQNRDKKFNPTADTLAAILKAAAAA